MPKTTTDLHRVPEARPETRLLGPRPQEPITSRIERPPASQTAAFAALTRQSR